MRKSSSNCDEEERKKHFIKHHFENIKLINEHLHNLHIFNDIRLEELLEEEDERLAEALREQLHEVRHQIERLEYVREEEAHAATHAHDIRPHYFPARHDAKDEE